MGFALVGSMRELKIKDEKLKMEELFLQEESSLKLNINLLEARIKYAVAQQAVGRKEGLCKLCAGLCALCG